MGWVLHVDIAETHIANFLEYDEFSGSPHKSGLIFTEDFEFASIPLESGGFTVPIPLGITAKGPPIQIDPVTLLHANQNPTFPPDLSLAPPVQPRRSERVRRSAIPNYYELYYHMAKDEGDDEDDSFTFQDAMDSNESQQWQEAMREKLLSMEKNQV
eukprot:TRINITY_DN17020_c0_g4_i1.p1 TRINITY_DN17020_c0_g4~~TRINITY_DN17020_c0_g4_i1.p1  ORF type:complete len:157 (+),score=31.74 TRINITY_DN17020_c0_g4_i1:192-662(+)